MIVLDYQNINKEYVKIPALYTANRATCCVKDVAQEVIHSQVHSKYSNVKPFGTIQKPSSTVHIYNTASRVITDLINLNFFGKPRLLNLTNQPRPYQSCDRPVDPSSLTRDRHTKITSPHAHSHRTVSNDVKLCPYPQSAKFHVNFFRDDA